MKQKNETLSKKNLTRTLKNIVLTILGTLILALGTAIFILPYNLITGGISGLALILEALVPILDIEVWITILTWGLFFVGLFALGKNFAIKTLISAIVYPIGIALFMPLAEGDVFGGFFNLAGSGYTEIAVLLASIFGGVLVGAGCAVTFLGGGSTGGVDVFSFLLCKIFPRLRSSKVIFVVDASIIIVGMFITNNLVISLLGIVSAFLAAIVIDKIFLGESRAFIANIISEEHEAIKSDVIAILDRTATVLDVTGGYTGKNQKMLMVTFTMNQYVDLLHLIRRHDKNAFVTIHPAHEINGYGWTF